MRVLLASTAGAGHFGPLLPFIETLARRGDEPVLVIPPELEDRARSLGFPYRLSAEPPAQEVDAFWRRFPELAPSKAAILVAREFFGRLGTAAMLPALEEALRAWRPELILHEPCAYAAAVVAVRSGIPHAQVAISLAKIEGSALAAAAPALETYGEAVVAAIRGAPYLTRLPSSLDHSPFSKTERFRDPRPPAHPLPDWWNGAQGPLVYLTLGTVAGRLAVGPGAFRAILRAISELPVRVLLTVGAGVEASTLGELPDNTHLEPWVAQDDVLGTASVVVCHGGSGTVFGALAAGVPLVVIPLFADQQRNAELVVTAGAGVAIQPVRRSNRGIGPIDASMVARIRAAVISMLAEGNYRRQAQNVAREMSAAPEIEAVIAGVTGEARRRL